MEKKIKNHGRGSTQKKTNRNSNTHNYYTRDVRQNKRVLFLTHTNAIRANNVRYLSCAMKLIFLNSDPFQAQAKKLFWKEYAKSGEKEMKMKNLFVFGNSILFFLEVFTRRVTYHARMY